MDTRQLEFFTAVAEEGNFTRAAERSFVSQPGLSSSIQALERELRVQLFERGRHGATLTSAGSAFLPRARHILRDVDNAQRALFSDDGAETPTVHIGAEQCFGDLVDLPDLLVAFGNSHPHAEITFSQDSTLELAAMLDDGTLDVAVMAFGTPADAPADAVLLRTEPFVLLRKEGSGTIGWDELSAMRFVDFSESWAARQVLDEAFAAAGKRRVSALVVSDVHMLLDLVQRGLGAAVVPASIAAKPEAQGLVATSVAHLGIDWGVYRVTKPDARPIAQAFAMMMVPQGTARELGDALVP